MILDYIFFKKEDNLMKSLKKLGILSAGVVTLSLAACGGVKCPPYMRDADEAVYAHVLGNFASIYSEAKAETEDVNLRFVKFAEAEAALMDSATFMPTTTQGGNYAMTRVAYHTIPYSMWGNDTDRVRDTVIVKNFITKDQRKSLKEAWEKARKDGTAYDPKGILVAAGHEVADTYATSFSTFPETLDVLNTSMQSDTESLVNAVDGLVEYDNLGNLQGRCAEEVPEPVLNDDGTESWTFEIKSGLKWYNADGSVYADLTAQDFVDGFHHMLDAQAGLEYLTQGVIVGADEYITGKITDFSKVGVKAEGNLLTFTLCQPESFFQTRLTYSCFMPMNAQYFLAKGGAFGIEEFKKASAKDSYKYGLVSDRTSVVYNGPYTPTKLVDQDEIVYSYNSNYSNYENEPSTKTLKWVYDSGDNPDASYDAAIKGDYNGVSLTEASGLLAKAKADGNFDKYSYQVDTNATTYFGGFNVNRGTFETGSVKSNKDDAQKIYTHRAMQNKNFRMALQHAWDRVTWNAVVYGEGAAKDNLRNIYTAPEFVSLNAETILSKDDYAFLSEDKVFSAGTQYGELVEFFLKNEFKRDVAVKDGQDGWYNAQLAKDYFESFKEEMGENVSYPIVIDVEYYSASKNQTAQANAFKESIEKSLGKDNVEVNLMAAATTDDYYAAGYRAANGEKGNFDVFYGSGWGPDYGDPSTYLDTFLGDGAGYMTKVLGLF